MTENKIIAHFIEDHKYYQNLFENYAKAKLRSAPNTTDVYNDLRNSIKRHSNQEEVLYSKFEPKDDELLKILDEVRQEHRKITNLLDDTFEEEDETELKVILEKLRKLLTKHINSEEKKLYPYFDDVLSKKCSDEIIDDIDMYDQID